MEITKLIDTYGDDIFAFALVVTKDFTSAKEIFVKTTTLCEEYPEECALFDLIKKAYELSLDTDSNETASTLTGIELDAKLQGILEELLVCRETVRAVSHMYYENDLTTAEIAKITGKSEKYIIGLLVEELPDDLRNKLDSRYKDICVKINAEDSLKAYVIRAVSTGDKRAFQIDEDAVPVHTWKTSHKVVVVIFAIIATLLIMFIIPVFQKYSEMLESEAGLSYEEVGTDESFYYTFEAETADKD